LNKRHFYIRLLLGVLFLFSSICLAQDSEKKLAPHSGMKEKISYDAKDSIISFPSEEIIHLYNDAEVTFGDFKLNAGFIAIDLKTNTVFAKGIADTSNQIIQKPVFIQGQDEFQADSLRFNIQTKKGKIFSLRTEESDGFIVGKEIKKLPDNSLFLKDGTFTTCNLDTPHFYIKTNKIKYTSDKKIITGPAHLVIEDLHTPLFIPFGYFPIGNEKSIGIVLPSYGFNARQGYSLNNLGLYIGISDYWDNKFTGTFYTNGSYILENNFNYAKRYKYNGDLFLKYAKNIGTTSSSDINYKIIWNHRQDSKANPFGRLTADVDFGSSDFNYYNSSNINTQLSNELTSSISYSRSYFNNFVNTNLSATHRQNTGTKIVKLTLPKLTVNTKTIHPFRNKNKKSSKKTFWDDIRITPRLNANSNLVAADSVLFESDTWKDLKSKVDYHVPIGLSLNLSDKFSISPSLNYDGYMYFEKFDYSWNETKQKLDTSSQGGFHHLYDVKASVAFSVHPTIYGMFPINKGRIKAIRHVMTPRLAWSYTPSQLLDNNRYYQHVQTDSTGNLTFLSQYGKGNFTPGNPSLDNEQNWGTLSFGLGNNLEMKIKERGDTTNTFKKVKLLEYLNFNSGYNFDRDSLNLNNISFNLQSKLARNFTLNMNGVFDPYQVKDGVRINEYTVDGGKLPILRSLGGSITFSLGSKKAKKRLEDKIESIDPETLDLQDRIELEKVKIRPNAYLDFNSPWSLSSTFTLKYSKELSGTIDVTKSFNFHGDISLTDKWKITYNSGWDFKNHDFSTTSLGFVRDLHCWQMTFDWIPVGAIQRFNFTINVKASILQDLKLTKKRDFYEF